MEILLEKISNFPESKLNNELTESIQASKGIFKLYFFKLIYNLDGLNKKHSNTVSELRKQLLETFTLILKNGKTKLAYLAVEGLQV